MIRVIFPKELLILLFTPSEINIRQLFLILNIKCKLCGGAQLWGLTVLCKHVERKQEMVDEKTAVFLNMMQSLCIT
jgi:hypothetical protein